MDSIFQNLNREQTWKMRQEYVADACLLHYDQNPIKLSHSEAQYFYDDTGQKYLDCVTRIANVGHCHPEVVKAAQSQMALLNLCNQTNGSIQTQFCSSLLKTLPPSFEVCFFTNSGAEANDLALQLARRYTGHDEVVVLENSFHGSLQKVIEISPVALQKQNIEKMPWLHVLPYPDTYRGSAETRSENELADEHFMKAKAVIDNAVQKGSKIGCFISETVLVVQGVIVPPGNWLSKIYSHIRQLGGLVIADEIQTGMGRCGTNFWGFQTQRVVPDILTIGKPIGNGYPIAAVVTSKEIARSIENLHEEYACCSVAAAVGKSVLKILEEERLMMNAKEVGQKFRDGLYELKSRFQWIGDVRGIGMITGLDIVWCKESKQPAPEIAQKVCYRLREERVLTESAGPYSNVIIFVPPLCITAEDVIYIINCLTRVFLELEIAESQEVFNLLRSQPGSSREEPELIWQESPGGMIDIGPDYYSLD
ncbi:ethanolamine-phosphate phospho-lyase-like [Ischnura elegans]|uniref:ethanolamine-phosphate phospho-lyase-like n=1 Tax=Ischnura elegans TaxID=197161 RepID=UPI001ED890A7|nr:ethanolamine-phosphate phospho-lyase-like [Ischnura elegans]